MVFWYINCDHDPLRVSAKDFQAKLHYVSRIRALALFSIAMKIVYCILIIPKKYGAIFWYVLKLTLPKFKIGLGSIMATALNVLSIFFCTFWAISQFRNGSFSPLLCCFVTMNLSIVGGNSWEYYHRYYTTVLFTAFRFCVTPQGVIHKRRGQLRGRGVSQMTIL